MSKTHKSRRPYLIQAIYDWAVDNGHTPHILVAADYPGVAVPRQYVQEGRITLNLSPMAVQSMHLDDDPLWFSARFSGRPFEVVIPSGAVLAIFARENGEGLVFGEVEPPEGETDAETGADPVVSQDEPPEPPKPKGRGHLRVVK
ncbi:ClpXP protease specificity-enhancing factor [Stagnimonas aquatica]|uniref:ClpXP protease specificity-enhancing factor n=1 Tax=Stagnimonas aquatica TaxID=2689987 RepID=A0A3N0VHE0_9GAMM|nr:ClpXP protease specificity-enhancing factor [Stagnimonas aquatica]ROH92186.1 ClpXP protease specificity-enhancing factor [Stagnimonas aquatica]